MIYCRIIKAMSVRARLLKGILKVQIHEAENICYLWSPYTGHPRPPAPYKTPARPRTRPQGPPCPPTRPRTRWQNNWPWKSLIHALRLRKKITNGKNYCNFWASRKAQNLSID